jgi:para-aminobenzoate synthetase
MGYEARHEANAILKSSRNHQPVQQQHQGIRKSSYDFSSALESDDQHSESSHSHNDNQFMAQIPKAVYMMPSQYLLYDHNERFLYIVTNTLSLSNDSQEAQQRASTSSKQLFQQVQQLLTDFEHKSNDSPLIHSPLTVNDSIHHQSQHPTLNASYLRSFKTKREYRESIQKALDYISEGETYEVCLTNQFFGDWDEQKSPFEVYKALRQNNPAPYSSYIHYNPRRLYSNTNARLIDDKYLDWCPHNGISVCCSSPERFLKIDHVRLINS